MAYMNKKTFELCSKIYNPNDSEKFFLVDDLIALPVQILNQKGYMTEFCCSGHPFEPQYEPQIKQFESEKKIYHSYIAFREGVISIPELPNGFYKELTLSDNLVIRKDYVVNDMDVYRILYVIIESMEQLYLWTLSLPTYTDYMRNRRI